ncbi:MAG: glycosyltransferase [Saprospiraceae bacterium]
MKILVTPLNWGLGHATRCIPIIKELERHGVKVLIASDGLSLKLLKKEFSEISFFKLPGYNINYKGKHFARTMLRQSPKALTTLYKEHQVIGKIVEENKIDVIISDCRYGCYHKALNNILISHQINTISPFPFLDKPINALNKFFISKFQHLWIPDFKGSFNLSGKLGHDHEFEAEYIGVLSRMKKTEEKKKYDIAIILSGPEPQRTELEKVLLIQVRQIKNKNIILIQGVPESTKTITEVNNNLKIISFLTSTELNKVMMAADMIISRSGYSTIMDLWRLQKPALLIPTPGQTEQIYLAERLQKRGLFIIQKQNQINLKNALSQIQNYRGFKQQQIPNKALSKTIEKFLNDI